MTDKGILATTVMSMAYVVLKPGLGESLVGTVRPVAGVADFIVDTLNVRFHLNLLAKALVTMFAFESSNSIMDSFYVLLEGLRLAKL